MQKKRYVILDALRGFAILGIILANFPEFSLWTFSSPDTWTLTDKVTRAVQTFLVDGKFYTLFSLLFGMGFSIQLSNAEGKLRTFYRRMAVLLVIGFAVGRERIYADIEGNAALLKKVLSWGLLLGIPVGILYTWSSMAGYPLGRVCHSAFYLLSVYPMGFAYAAGFALLFGRRPDAPGWKLLSSPGRMACTNYLGQSVIGIILFYGIGFALGNKVGLLATEIIALAVYAFQIGFSSLWMRHCKFGPVEWIWRMLTYGKKLHEILPASRFISWGLTIWNFIRAFVDRFVNSTLLRRLTFTLG